MMEITSSGVSVYEVILDLKQWEGRLSHEVPGFVDSLIRFMPSTASHKCMPGHIGGFHEELIKGTNFGHVVEHVLLELIHLSDPDHAEFSGWTKDLGDGQYVIHYGAPGFLTGRLAAILAVEIVAELQQGKEPDLESQLVRLRNPMEYFTQDRMQQLEPRSGVDQESVAVARDLVPVLSDMQCENLSSIFDSVADLLPSLNQRWRTAFYNFGGEFARGILDKIELIHPDHSLECLISGKFNNYFQGVANLSQMMNAMHIPLNFVTHAAWQYKNFLQLVILNSLTTDQEAQATALWDFDEFYQNIFHNILGGYARTEDPEVIVDDVNLCGFRARKARKSSVLVVDDDVMARKVAVSILTYHDIPTIEARDGMDALSILVEKGSEVGLVLLDVVMPGMSGQAVCRRIMESHPKAKIILYSGYPLEKASHCLLDEHKVSFLQKPFTSTELIDLVNDMLDLEVTGNGKPCRSTT